MSYGPRSPEKTIRVCFPFSVTVSSSQDDPRMCPASCGFTENSGLMVNASLREIFRNCCNAALAWGTVYSGSGGSCLLDEVIAAYFASSSCRCAESGSRMSHNSTVAPLAKIGPLKPSRTNRGRYPVWSIWAWVSNTQSMELGGTGKGFQLRRRNSFSPWNNPQSTSRRLPAASIKYLEPVTVPAAPRKVIWGIGAIL